MIKLLLIFIVFVASNSFAAPSISSFSGIIDDGESITISGTNFGATIPAYESLIANIESSTAGNKLSKTNWTYGASGATNTDVVYATDDYHSGSQSLKCPQFTEYNCGYSVDLATALDSVEAGEKAYITWWVKYSGQTDGQWKMGRFESTISVVDNTEQLAFHNWLPDSSGSNTMIIDPSGGLNDTTYVGSATYPRGNDGWFRMEIEMQASTVGSTNGYVNIRKTSAAGVVNTRDTDTLETHGTGYSYNYFFWQNYIGNGITDATIWFDDNYVQQGTFARVELCSGSSWSDRKRCEIQPPTAWSDTSVSVTFNSGTFNAGSHAYLYVVDSDGVANTSGYPIIIGDGTGKSFFGGNSHLNIGGASQIRF